MMSRLPLQYAGKDITLRIPWSMYGDQDFAAESNGEVFPEATFLMGVDKPFEMHRVIIRCTGLDDEDEIIEPQPTTLEKRVFLRIQDLSKNQSITKNSTAVENLILANTGAWDWEEPYTFVRGESFQVQCDIETLPTVCTVDPDDCSTPLPVVCTQVRVALNFQGFLLIIAPPTEDR